MSEEELGVRGWLHKCKYFIIYLVMWLFFSPLGKSFNKGIVLLQQRKWARREMRTHPKSTNGGGNLPSSSVGTYIFKDMGIIHTNGRIKSEPSVVYDTNQKMAPAQWKRAQQEFHSQAWPQSYVWCRLLGWTSSRPQAQAVSVVEPSLRPGQAGTRQRCIPLVNTDPLADYGFTFNALHLGRGAAWTAGIFPREIQNLLQGPRTLPGYMLPAEWRKKPKQESPDEGTSWSQAPFLLVLALHSKVDIKITELPLFC